MAVTVTYRSTLKVIETLTGNHPFALDAKAKVIHDQMNTAKDDLDAASDPPATKVAAFQQALTAGSATIDLTALPGTNGQTVSGTGLKVQALKLRNPAANENPITVAVGSANGYEAFGADWSVTLEPGQEALFFGNDATPDVGSGAKTLDLTGTLVEALDVLVVLG